MLSNAYFLAKIGADTAENEQHFAEILPKTGNYPTGPVARPSTSCARCSPSRAAHLEKLACRDFSVHGYVLSSDLKKRMFASKRISIPLEDWTPTCKEAKRRINTAILDGVVSLNRNLGESDFEKCGRVGSSSYQLVSIPPRSTARGGRRRFPAGEGGEWIMN